MSMAERYRRWFEYERDAQSKVMAAFGAVPEPLRATPDFQAAVDLMAHMIAARELWLYRFGVLAQAPANVFPSRVTLADAQARLVAMETVWLEYLAPLDDAQIARPFEYVSLDGQRFRSRIEDILTQLFGHAWYHRGQIATHLRAIDATPAATDFVLWCREAL